MIREASDGVSRVGLSSADIEKQIKVIETRRAEMTRQLDFVNQKLTEAITKLKKMRKRVHETGETVDAKIFYFWETEEAELRRKKMAHQDELGRLRRVVKRLRGDQQIRQFAEARASHTTTFEVDTLTRLGQLRDKYESFAADGTRVNSMRLMAGEFAKELTALMREVGLMIDA